MGSNKTFDDFTVDDLVRMSESLGLKRERPRSRHDDLMRQHLEDQAKTEKESMPWLRVQPLIAPKFTVEPFDPSPVSTVNVKKDEDDEW